MNNLDKWQDRRFSRPERMRAFEKWLFGEIIVILKGNRIRMTVLEMAKFTARTRGDMLRLIAKMGKLGWFLDRDDLREMVNKAVLSPLERFKDGKVSDPYPYMKRILSDFLDSQADWLKERSMSAGTHINQLMGGVEGRDNMTAIVAGFLGEAENQREYKELKKRAKVKAEKNQLNLFT